MRAICAVFKKYKHLLYMMLVLHLQPLHRLSQTSYNSLSPVEISSAYLILSSNRKTGGSDKVLSAFFEYTVHSDFIGTLRT